MVSYTHTHTHTHTHTSRTCTSTPWQQSNCSARIAFPITPIPYYIYRSQNPHSPLRRHNLPSASLGAAGRNCRCIPALRLSPTSRSPVSPPRAAVLISGRDLARVGSVVVGLGLVFVELLILHRRHHFHKYHCLRDVYLGELFLQCQDLAVVRPAYPAVSSSATVVYTKVFERAGRTRSTGSQPSVRFPSSHCHDLVWPSLSSLSGRAQGGAL